MKSPFARRDHAPSPVLGDHRHPVAGDVVWRRRCCGVDCADRPAGRPEPSRHVSWTACLTCAGVYVDAASRQPAVSSRQSRLAKSEIEAARYRKLRRRCPVCNSRNTVIPKPCGPRRRRTRPRTRAESRPRIAALQPAEHEARRVAGGDTETTGMPAAIEAGPSRALSWVRKAHAARRRRSNQGCRRSASIVDIPASRAISAAGPRNDSG